MERNIVRKKKLPIGIERFEKIRTEGFYYVDKTGLIKDLLENCGEVNLFTRPRRFGKSLNMNMLKHFFEYGCDPQLFEGLAISAEPLLCQEHMGKYPVISITLKDVSGNGYTTALEMLRSVIGREAMRFQFLYGRTGTSAPMWNLETKAFWRMPGTAISLWRWKRTRRAP